MKEKLEAPIAWNKCDSAVRKRRTVMRGGIIVAIILVICISAIFRTPKTTPFDNLVKCSTVDYVIQEYGKDGQISQYGTFLSGKIVRYDYVWLGYKGKLAINTEMNEKSGVFGGDFYLKDANWSYYYGDENPERIVDKISKTLDRKYGKSSMEDGNRVWYDIYNNQYSLWVNSTRVTVAFK